MDPITMVVAALAAGAAAGVSTSSQDATAAVLRSSCRQIRTRVLRRAPDPAEAERVLDAHAGAPSEHEQALRAVLMAANAAADSKILEAARAILGSPPSAHPSGKYPIQINNGKGVVVGDFTDSNFTFYEGR
jgi:hypothetical protein